jgi:hypothetical protein
MVGVATAYALVARPWHLQWSATVDEARSSLPGDELIPDADLVATRAVTVRASPDAVWPWIAQLRQGRGGFYSCDFLENLFGCDIHSVDHVVPALQNIQSGDELRLAPTVPLEVAAVERGGALVLRGAVPMGDAALRYDFSWAFVLTQRWTEPPGSSCASATRTYSGGRGCSSNPSR